MNTEYECIEIRGLKKGEEERTKQEGQIAQIIQKLTDQPFILGGPRDEELMICFEAKKGKYSDDLPKAFRDKAGRAILPKALLDMGLELISGEWPLYTPEYIISYAKLY